MAKKSRLKKSRAKSNEKVIRGSPLNYNAVQGARYQTAILQLIKQMTAEVEKEVEKLFSSETGTEFFSQDASIASQSRILLDKLEKKFLNLFSRRAKAITESMINGSLKSSSSSLRSSLSEMSGGLSLKTNAFTSTLKEKLTAIVNGNVGLITTIPSTYLGGVKDAVSRSITSGNGLQDLVPYMQQHKQITERHARNVALDQTRKAYNTINAERMQSVGVKRFEWLHSGGGQHPRPDHVAMSGNIYSFDDLPIIDKRTGERGIPGQAINCKCRMIPVIEFDGQEQ
ncbi:phage head morphogenesis protein [Jinshanibacter sp. LJY008]|uniref:Phage head morphogenesis protein n=1 Tax=Limnobaculum eriocheiris TaxID=2897391 RepID=A0A9X1SIV3_9GAMM|nr:phage minor head protein [Limnobaculum eriocheiris]MCD1124818.1 phage head morphogenesis protein [Limnobaculum eriocheiris]